MTEEKPRVRLVASIKLRFGSDEPNTYEQKQEARKAALLAKAEKARAEADRQITKAATLPEGMDPFQPILVGHHSEKKHRRDIEKRRAAADRSVEATKLAAYYEEKAATVGKGGISSDDPDAIPKLQNKVDALKAELERMKKANAIIRKKEKCDLSVVSSLKDLGLPDDEVLRIAEPRFGSCGYSRAELANRRETIKGAMNRIARLEKLAAIPDTTRVCNGYTVMERRLENRVMFLFHHHAGPERNAIMKRHAFRYSPSRKVWQRQLTMNARRAVPEIEAELAALREKGNAQ